jgi:8-oxo-dGTP pyrophosphatase MutT (NUDIX family)
MLERPARGFFGGLWVFPGGGVEPIDEGPLAAAAVSMPDGASDHRWRAAALRETVEEVGLAITREPWSGPLVASGEEVFGRVLAGGTTLDGHRLQLLSQWVTPAEAPTRFDARFYLTTIEGDPPLVAHPEEVIDLTWTTPSNALRRGQEGNWAMVTPTLHHLEWLARQSGPRRAWEVATGTLETPAVSRIESDGSEVLVRLPSSSELP